MWYLTRYHSSFAVRLAGNYHHCSYHLLARQTSTISQVRQSEIFITVDTITQATGLDIMTDYDYFQYYVQVQHTMFSASLFLQLPGYLLPGYVVMVHVGVCLALKRQSVGHLAGGRTVSSCLDFYWSIFKPRTGSSVQLRAPVFFTQKILTPGRLFENTLNHKSATQ